jgi:hypothetical protein
MGNSNLSERATPQIVRRSGPRLRTGGHWSIGRGRALGGGMSGESPQDASGGRGDKAARPAHSTPFGGFRVFVLSRFRGCRCGAPRKQPQPLPRNLESLEGPKEPAGCPPAASLEMRSRAVRRMGRCPHGALLDAFSGGQFRPSSARARPARPEAPHRAMPATPRAGPAPWTILPYEVGAPHGRSWLRRFTHSRRPPSHREPIGARWPR